MCPFCAQTITLYQHTSAVTVAGSPVICGVVVWFVLMEKGRAGLKIPRVARPVPVRVRLPAPNSTPREMRWALFSLLFFIGVNLRLIAGDSHAVCAFLFPFRG